MLSVQQQTISADEFWEIVQRPEYEGVRLELVEGVIHQRAGGTGGAHGEITHQCARLVGNFVADHHLGRMTAVETCYVLYKNPNGKDTVRCPDIGFITLQHAPTPLTSGYIPFAPDLAVEVISPGNEAIEIHNKVLDYLRYGTQLIWVIYPDSQTVVVHTPSGANILTIDDTLDGGQLLPGLRLPVRDIFPA